MSRIWADMIESDRFIALLTCGHWIQTRRPADPVYQCERCRGESRNVAVDQEDPSIRAVLQSWDYFDATA